MGHGFNTSLRHLSDYLKHEEIQFLETLNFLLCAFCLFVSLSVYVPVHIYIPVCVCVCV